MSFRPAKLLLRLWMKDIYRLSSGYEIGLDVACNDMRGASHFRTDRYVGVDLNPDVISSGLLKHPEAEGFVWDIGRLRESGIRGDFVVCLQTLGMNKRFIESGTSIEQAIENLVFSCRQNGGLCFNVGPCGGLLFDWIQRYLESWFDTVSVCFYGAHNKFVRTRSEAKEIALDMYNGVISYAPLKDEDRRGLYFARGKKLEVRHAYLDI